MKTVSREFVARLCAFLIGVVLTTFVAAILTKKLRDDNAELVRKGRAFTTEIARTIAQGILADANLILCRDAVKRLSK